MPEAVGKECKNHGIRWHNLPIPGARPAMLFSESFRIVKSVRTVLNQMKKKQEKVLVHCAAGIHRTGVFTYSILRAIGLTAKQAMEKIKELRMATFKSVGDFRIFGADKHIIPSLLKIIKEE